MTVENIIKDGMEKREGIKKYEKFPQDVLKIIALDIDIRQLLEFAKKDTLFASLLNNNDFWKKKYYHDFPEVKNLSLPLSEKFKNNYFVVRYWLIKSRQYIFSEAQFNVSDGVELRLSYDKETETIKVKTFIELKQVGSVKEIDFDNYFSSKYSKIRNNYFECKRNNYIEQFIASEHSNELIIINISDSAYYREKKYYFLKYLIRKRDSFYFDEFVKNFKDGFVSKKEGKPVIGYSVF